MRHPSPGDEKIKSPAVKFLGLSLLGIGIVMIICGAFVMTARQQESFSYLSVTGVDPASVKAKLETRNATIDLPPHLDHYETFEGPYRISVTIEPKESVNITVDPGDTSLLIKVAGFEAYKDWSILVNGEPFFPHMMFDWSGKSEMLIPLYKKPKFALCIEAQKQEGDPLKVCHGIVQEHLS